MTPINSKTKKKSQILGLIPEQRAKVDKIPRHGTKGTRGQRKSSGFTLLRPSYGTKCSFIMKAITAIPSIIIIGHPQS